MRRRQRRQKQFATSLVALAGIVLAAFMWRVGAFGNGASGDSSPETIVFEEQDELNLNSFALKSTPSAAARPLDQRRRSPAASEPDATAEPSARNDVDASAETTAENVDQEVGENSSGGGGISPFQFAPLTANGAGAGFWGRSGAASPGFGTGAAPLRGSAGSESLANNNGEIPADTASAARVGRAKPNGSSEPAASPGGNGPRSDGAVSLLTDENFAAALEPGSPGAADDSVLETTFAEEPSALPPPAPPLRANPEPASLLMLATGLGLVARKLQRRTKTSRQA